MKRLLPTLVILVSLLVYAIAQSGRYGSSTGSGTAIESKDEGTSLTTSTESFDFTGAGVTATTVGNAVTISIPGGGSTLAFEKIKTSSGTSPVADASNDSLILQAGTNIAIAGTASNDSINIGITGEIADANIADNITLTNITQITTRNYSDLQNRSHEVINSTALGADVTISGAVAGQVFRATGATTAALDSVRFSDLLGSASDAQIPDLEGLSTSLANSGIVYSNGTNLTVDATNLSFDAGTNRTSIISVLSDSVDNFTSGASYFVRPREDGDIFLQDSTTITGLLTVSGNLDIGSNSLVYGTGSLSNADLELLDDQSIASSEITDDTIVDADINSAAAISISKTALVAGTNITLSTNTLNVDDAFVLNAGDAITGDLDFNDGVGDSPQADFTPATGTAWSIYAEDTGDDLQIVSAATASTEDVDILNPGAGAVRLLVEGDLVATATNTVTLTNKTIDADNNTISNIDNGEIKAAAGIVYSKLSFSNNIVAGDIATDAVGELELAESMNFTPTGSWNFGGGTVELPNSAAPSLTVLGQVEYENDAEAIVVRGTNEQRRMPTLNIFDKTLVHPEGINDEMELFYVNSTFAPSGIKIVSVSISMPADATYTMTFEEWSSADPAVWVANIEAVATSAASNAEVTGISIDDSDIAAGNRVYLDIPTTTTDWIHVQILYYIK